MCTVSFIPLDGKIILTSNRDEDINRPALVPKQFNKNGIILIYPEDPKAKGTWIAIEDQHKFVCLLNGAANKHQHQPPYRQSRGKVVTDYFGYKNVNEFVANYNLKNIEPFTLIIFDDGLFEFRWDGNQKHYKVLDEQIPHIYSSSTLYTPEIVAKREQWFKKFLKEAELTESNILNFHKFAGDGNSRTDLRMVLEGKTYKVQTTSVTQIIKTKDSIQLSYHDLIEDNVAELGF